MSTTKPDDALLSAAQAGDAAALGQLLRAHRNGVYRYGLRVCRSTEDAEDAVQETLWAATRAIKTFRGTASSIASWMFTIVRRECYRLIERQREVAASPALWEETAAKTVDPEQSLTEERRARLLTAALRTLDLVQREVLILRDIEQLSAPEAAARLGISVPALKSRLHRARVHLRDALGHADGF